MNIHISIVVDMNTIIRICFFLATTFNSWGLLTRLWLEFQGLRKEKIEKISSPSQSESRSEDMKIFHQRAAQRIEEITKPCHEFLKKFQFC